MSRINGMGGLQFADGQYIICVDCVVTRANGQITGKIEEGITIGKLYRDITDNTVPIESRFAFYKIINDDGIEESYYQKYFKILTLDEAREFKLISLRLND